MTGSSWSADPSLDTSLDNHSVLSSSHTINMSAASGTIPPGYGSVMSHVGYGQDPSHPPNQHSSGGPSVFAQRPASRDRNAFDLRPGTCYFSLVLVVLGVCFVCPTPMVDETMIDIVNRLLSYGNESKVREFTHDDLNYFQSNYGIISAQTDAWVDFLRLMWSEQFRQLEWILHGLSHGFRHGADPISGLDIELYKDTNVVMSRYLYIEGEMLDLHSTDTPALRKILIDIIAEAVQCDVVRPGEHVTDTWSNGAASPTPDRRRRGPKRSKFEPENIMPNFPPIRDQPGRHFPYTRERVSNHIAGMSYGARMQVADRLGLRVQYGQAQQYQLDPTFGAPRPSGQRSLGAPFQYGPPLRDVQPDAKRQRTSPEVGQGQQSAQNLQPIGNPVQQNYDQFRDPFNASPHRLAVNNRISASPVYSASRPQLHERSQSTIVSMSPRTQLPTRSLGSTYIPSRSSSKKRLHDSSDMASIVETTEADGGGHSSRASLQLPHINEAIPEPLLQQTAMTPADAETARRGSGLLGPDFKMTVAGSISNEHGFDPSSLQLAPMETNFADFGGGALS